MSIGRSIVRVIRGIEGYDVTMHEGGILWKTRDTAVSRSTYTLPTRKLILLHKSLRRLIRKHKAQCDTN
jgi:hypothetical protein